MDHAAARGRGRAFLCSLGRRPGSSAGAVGSRPPGQEWPVPLPCSTCLTHLPPLRVPFLPLHSLSASSPWSRPPHPRPWPLHSPHVPAAPPHWPLMYLQPWPAVSYPHPTCSPRSWGSPEHAVLLSPRGLQSGGLFSSVKPVCCPFVGTWPRAASSYSSRDPPPNPKR